MLASYRTTRSHDACHRDGTTSYFMAVTPATRDDDTVDCEKIDRYLLYKVRECFISIMDKADDLAWAATMRRAGLCVYNTFVFLYNRRRCGIATRHATMSRHTCDIMSPSCRYNSRRFSDPLTSS